MLAERLGIGTSSPAAPLHLKVLVVVNYMSSRCLASIIKHNQSTDALKVYPDGSLAMTLQAGVKQSLNLMWVSALAVQLERFM